MLLPTDALTREMDNGHHRRREKLLFCMIFFYNFYSIHTSECEKRNNPRMHVRKSRQVSHQLSSGNLPTLPPSLLPASLPPSPLARAITKRIPEVATVAGDGAAEKQRARLLRLDDVAAQAHNLHTRCFVNLARSGHKLLCQSKAAAFMLKVHGLGSTFVSPSWSNTRRW